MNKYWLLSNIKANAYSQWSTFSPSNNGISLLVSASAIGLANQAYVYLLLANGKKNKSTIECEMQN